MKNSVPVMRKTYKEVISLDPESLIKVMFMSRVMARLRNMAIDESLVWLQNKAKRISNITFNYWLTGVRKTSATLNDGTNVQFGEISSDCQREILRKLAGSWQSYFELKKKGDKRAKRPMPKDEEVFHTLSWSSFSLKDQNLILPAYAGERICIKLTPYLEKKLEGRRIVHVTISKNYKGQFQLNIVVASKLPEKIKDPKFFRAIDLGAGDIAITDSNGSEFLIPARRPDKFWKDQILLVESRQKKRKKGSRSYKKLSKARQHMYKISENQKKSHQRKLALAILEEKVDCIVIGKAKTRLGLSISESGTTDQHYGVQNTGLMYRLLTFIKEKAEERGVIVLELPDPKRKGELRAENKFFATRQLLAKAMSASNLPIPNEFIRKNFYFDQGKGQKPEAKV